MCEGADTTLNTTILTDSLPFVKYNNEYINRTRYIPDCSWHSEADHFTCIIFQGKKVSNERPENP